MSEVLSIVLAKGTIPVVLPLISLLLLTACGPRPGSPEPVAIAAASDLAPLGSPLQELIQERTGQEVVFSFGSSGALARQIEQGAPFDLFLSANEGYVNQLASGGFVEPDSIRIYALGRLGIWFREGTNADLERLTAPDVQRVAIPNPAFAPYGVAARDILVRADLWERLQAKIVYGENVRQTAQFAESGNVDAAISSWTTIRPLNGTPVAADRHTPIRQAGAVVNRSTKKHRARQILDVLSGEAGRALLRRHEFELPGSGDAPVKDRVRKRNE